MDVLVADGIINFQNRCVNGGNEGDRGDVLVLLSCEKPEDEWFTFILCLLKRCVTFVFYVEGSVPRERRELQLGD